MTLPLSSLVCRGACNAPRSDCPKPARAKSRVTLRPIDGKHTLDHQALLDRPRSVARNRVLHSPERRRDGDKASSPHNELISRRRPGESHLLSKSAHQLTFRAAGPVPATMESDLRLHRIGGMRGSSRDETSRVAPGTADATQHRVAFRAQRLRRRPTWWRPHRRQGFVHRARDPRRSVAR